MIFIAGDASMFFASGNTIRELGYEMRLVMPRAMSSHLCELVGKVLQ